MNNELTFGGHPVTMEYIDNEVYITCKGLTGTRKQVGNFLKNKGNGRFKFGESLMKMYPKRIVRIDCLKDTIGQIEFLYNKSKTINK